RVRPLEAAHLDAQAETVPRVVGAVRVEEPSVVEVVVHHREAFLVGRGALAEITVPAPVPARIVGVVDLVRPNGRPGARIAAHGGRAPAIGVRIGLEEPGPRPGTPNPGGDPARSLAPAAAPLPDVALPPIPRLDLSEHQ